MPRNLRNFWVELDVDGYANVIARGPKNRNGHFNLAINVAHDGASEELLTIVGVPLANGRNRVTIRFCRDLTKGEITLADLLSKESAVIVLEDNREKQ